MLRSVVGSTLVTAGVVAIGVGGLTQVPTSDSAADVSPRVERLIEAPAGTEVSESEFLVAEEDVRRATGQPKAPARTSSPAPSYPRTYESTTRIDASDLQPVAGRRKADKVMALGKSMGFRPVGVRNGQVQVAGGIRDVSWDKTSAKIGSAKGTSRLFWHRDADAKTHAVKAPLWSLPHAKPGTRIDVRVGGRTHRYEVVRQETFDKSRPPLAMWDSTSPGRLAIQTCGGRLVKTGNGTWRWSARVVTWARLVR